MTGNSPPLLAKPLPTVRLLEFPSIRDTRGDLSFGQYPEHLPFQPKRFFVVYDVPAETVRGGHGHRRLERVLICVKGSCQITVDDGLARRKFTLNSPKAGIYLPPLTWGSVSDHSADCVLLVLASDVYEENDYLREYDEFLALVAARANESRLLK